MTGNRRLALERATNHVGLVVIETPRGFEADRFVDQLQERLRQVVKADVVEIVDPDAIDANASHDVAILYAPLHAGLRAWRDTAVHRFEASKPTILVLPVGVSGDVLIEEPVPTLLIDGAALRMTAPDVVEMATASCGDGLVGEGVAELLVQLSDGWPAWLFGCCAAIAEDQLEPDQLIATVGLPPFRRRIVKRLLFPFSAGDRYRMAQLAHFGHFSDQAAVAVGGIEFAETVLPHAPGLYRTRGGRLRFVDPVRQELMAEVPLDPAASEALAPVLIADGELLSACHALLDGGLHEQACMLIESLPGRVIDMSDQRELLGVMRVLADRVDDHPRLALVQARVHANLAEIAASVESCEVAIAASLAHDPIRLEASVELLLYRHRTIGQEEAADLLASLREEVGVGGPLPTRLREVEAQILGQSKDPHVVQAAADRFVEVASEWEFQREHLRAAKTLRGLAIGPLLHLGQFRQAQERLEQASRLAISQTFDYGVTMTMKALFDAQCGDWESARRSTEQAELIVDELGIRWLSSFTHLAEAYEAVAHGSARRGLAAVRAGRDAQGPLFETDTGVWFASLAATLLAQAEAAGEARRLLDSVADRAHQNQLEFGLADIVLLARAGDRDAARAAWSELDATTLVPNDRRWRIDLELARADRLAGVASDVDLDSVKAELERLGLASLFPLLAPELDEEAAVNASLRVGVLGGLAVSGTCGSIELPEGHVRRLVKILAVHGGSTTVDAVVDHLWPDVELPIGIRRLKNVVKKTREALGVTALVREGDVVAFGPGVRLDVDDFEEAIARMRASRRHESAVSRDAAIRAVELYQGPLLPDETFDDVINHRRFELSLAAADALQFLETAHRPSAAWFAAASQRVDAG